MIKEILAELHKQRNFQGIYAFSAEREKQIQKGHTVESDVEHNNDYELAIAAQLIAFTPNEHMEPEDRYEILLKLTGWDPYFCETVLLKTYKDRLRIAGALLAAEYDRIIYLENNQNNDSNRESNAGNPESNGQ